MKRFIILMYHMINKPLSQEEKRYACSRERFAEHVSLLSRKYNAVTLDQIHEYMKCKCDIPENAFAITLDDGFADNYDSAFPILDRYSIPATVFLTAGFIGGTNSWMNKKGFPVRKLLTWDQIKIMKAGGITFGAHTMTHPRLQELDREVARGQIIESKRLIEDKLESEVLHFAYPFGDFSDDVVSIVRDAGFESACSTRSGFNQRSADPFLLRRLEVYGTDSVWQLKQKITFGTNDSSCLFPVRYYLSRLRARVARRNTFP